MPASTDALPAAAISDTPAIDRSHDRPTIAGVMAHTRRSVAAGPAAAPQATVASVEAMNTRYAAQIPKQQATFSASASRPAGPPRAASMRAV